MKLSRDLSELVVFTNSVATQECLDEGTPGDVLSFSETRAQSLVSHRAEHFLAFNQRQLSRIYPSAYRIDSSNFNPQFYWNVGCQLVALNYQTEGRMMQLNRAKFMVNGGSGYVLKPPPMCKGSFNPFCDEPLPAFPKKQLILKIISGQQLPKPPDSMLGDRGEIIDPFVEVEIIGLPVDCCKEQTRVVDDNGFNPVWEETLSFTLHMAEVALVRFLVWDHDPIGRDFVGQRTVAFSSLMPGYRHVYLEGLTEASIFVHISVHDTYGKGHQLRGIRGLFNRSSKSSVDTNTGPALRKRSLSDHFLRRTASAPAKGRKKTKMALAESLASISDRKNSCVAGAGGEGMDGRGEEVEKRNPPRAPLVHRPISMPLEKLLQGQLSLCSAAQEQQDTCADAGIGTCPFDRHRSISVDLLIESSASLEPRVFSPSKKYTNRNIESDHSEETSYLVIGGGEARSVNGYSKGQSQDRVNGGTEAEIISTAIHMNCFGSPSENHQRRQNKPETSSVSTTYTVAPSISSSSSAPSSEEPLSPANGNRSYLKSPCSLQDSTISRLIDAVSLGNENDTCGSISALIGQFDITVEQNDLAISNGDGNTDLNVPSVPSHASSQKSSTPNKSTFKSVTRFHDSKNLISPQKSLQDILSPLKTTRTPNHTGTMKGPLSPHKVTPKSSQAEHPTPHLFSSPETTEQEEVYTILDEEVLAPTSVYNLKEQTVRLQAHSVGSTPSNSLSSSPMKVPQGLGKEAVGWVVNQIQRGNSAEVREAEESVYEEVYDPPGPMSEAEWKMSTTYVGPSVNGDRFRPNSLMEVEINVDEDPLEIMLTSPRHGSTWGGLTSPTKRHAIYQKNESTPSYSHQNLPSPHCTPQRQLSSHASHLKHSQCSSQLSQPSFQPSHHHQLPSSFQPSPFHRPLNSRTSNPSPLCQNGYPTPQNKPESFDRDRDFSRSSTQQRSCNGSQVPYRCRQDRLGDEQMEMKGAGCFQNGSSSECLPGLSLSLSRDRGLYSPTSDCDVVYSQLDYDCVTPASASSASHYTQPRSQSQAPSYTQTQPPMQAFSQRNNRQQSQPQIGASPQTCLGPIPALPQSGHTASQAPNPCKSKSLGDLTSEDILCNFQSKYHIISRSFITPCTRGRRKVGGQGGLPHRPQSADPLTEQLRKLVSLEGDDSDRDRPDSPQLPQVPKPLPPQSQPQSAAPSAPRDIDDSPPLLSRRLSSRSQSRVRHINSRARERQQEALKPRTGSAINGPSSVGGVVLRNKPSSSQNPAANRHSTGSYIAGYLGQLEDRGLPEGACTSLRYGYGDQYGDHYYTDDSLLPAGSSCPPSEPEVYFLLRL